MYRELKPSDVVVFNSESGTGSFVKVKNKGIYFMPAKKGLRLEGEVKPISKGERFIYIDYEILKRESPRILRMSLMRQNSGEKCFISENDLFNYFAYSKDQNVNNKESIPDD